MARLFHSLLAGNKISRPSAGSAIPSRRFRVGNPVSAENLRGEETPVRVAELVIMRRTVRIPYQ